MGNIYCIVRSDTLYGMKIARCCVYTSYRDALSRANFFLFIKPELKKVMYPLPVPLKEAVEMAASYGIPLMISTDL